MSENIAINYLGAT